MLWVSLMLLLLTPTAVLRLRTTLLLNAMPNHGAAAAFPASVHDYTHSIERLDCCDLRLFVARNKHGPDLIGAKGERALREAGEKHAGGRRREELLGTCIYSGQVRDSPRGQQKTTKQPPHQLSIRRRTIRMERRRGGSSEPRLSIHRQLLLAEQRRAIGPGARSRPEHTAGERREGVWHRKHSHLRVEAVDDGRRAGHFKLQDFRRRQVGIDVEKQRAKRVFMRDDRDALALAKTRHDFVFPKLTYSRTNVDKRLSNREI
eukprot:1328728-Rhodomonas_salina.2